MAKKAKKSAKKAPKNTQKKTAKKPVKTGGKKKDGRSDRQSWSKEDIKQLKTLIKENTPTRLIALKLKRSEISVRGKAQREGLSLRPTNRSPRD